MMKKKALGVVIASLLSANVHAESMTFEQSTVRIMEKMGQLAELAKDPNNVTQTGEQKYLEYKGKRLRINYDGNVKFDLFDFDSEFETVFDFIPKEWEKYWYDGGFDIFPLGFYEAEKCTFGLYAAARGSKDNQGNYIWERPQTTSLDTSECRELSPVASIFFNQNTYENHLSGALSGAVLFAQAHIIPASSLSDEKRMHLVGERKTKVMLKPEQAFDDYTKVTLKAFDKQGMLLGELEMKHPNQLAKNALAIPELDNLDVDFSYDADAVFNVRTVSSDAIAEALKDNNVVELKTWNGHWIRDFSLEQNNPALDGKTVIFTSSAGYNSQVNYYQERKKTIINGTSTVFKNVKGTWVVSDDLVFNQIGYANGMWSADLPKEWLKPGLSLTFSNQDKTGSLDNINIGAPTELLMHTIDVGMLVEPRKQFHFQYDKEAQREYFETAPLSKMIVSEYQPLHLTEVMLPDGMLLTDHDPSEGGWHGGTMRQRIGKELISIGINNANYGIHSTAGVGEGENPYLAAQLTAHNTRGNYSNGVQTHGGSGGAGMVTLDSSIGNEFSHEVGHNYGLGHYPGGFEGSIHKPAHMTNSTWGWDSARDVFIPNFEPINTNKESCLDGQCVPAFNDMFRFGHDSMAGGWAMYDAQRFTLYTPYSMHFIQKNLESKIVFDETSSTGYRKWDQASETMREYTHQIDALEVSKLNPWDANAEFITQLFVDFDKVDLSTWNGHWARNMSLPLASAANKGKIFTFNSDAGYHSYLEVNGEEMLVPYGSRLTFVSDGESWVQNAEFESKKTIRPEQYGVAVTTLVGYYDPKNELPSYIYPALHGAYGYVYADDSSTLSKGQCVLEVETANGDVLKYALKNNRTNAEYMNKFHVNVAQSLSPVSAAVVCDERELDRFFISAPTQELNYTVQGEEKPVSRMAFTAEQSVKRVLPTRYEPQACSHADGEHHH